MDTYAGRHQWLLVKDFDNTYPKIEVSPQLLPIDYCVIYQRYF